MIRVYFDSGTSNTRIYLVRDNRILGRASRAIGSRDSALAGNRAVLVSALKELYDTLLDKNKLQDSDIDEIWMSGMISCPSGMVDIEHVPTPVDCAALSKKVAEYAETNYFKRNIKIVPGLKTISSGVRATLDTVAGVNNVRGEEIEVFGMLRQYPALQTGRVIVVLPGSHTQVLFLTDGVIDDILSNVTGELYSAVCKQSIIGASVEGEENTPIDPDQVLRGVRNVEQYGFNRALYIVRSMELFSDSNLSQRRSYLEGVLNAGVMHGISAITKNVSARIVVAGGRKQYDIISAMNPIYPQYTISFAEASPAEPFSVSGMVSLAENSFS